MENNSKKETRYDWPKASDWANYIATDCEGNILEFENLPAFFAQKIWISRTGRTNFLGVTNNFEDYRDSLEERPKDMKKTKYDWSEIPDWAQHVAIDSKGDQFAFEEEPKLHYGGFWAKYGGRSCFLENVGFCENWKDSLEKRPLK